jgi:hypothetical protein
VSNKAEAIIAKPFAVLKQVTDPKSADGAKISSTEAKKLSKAIDDAVEKSTTAKGLTPEDRIEEIPGRIGFGMMESMKPDEFVSRKDYQKLWNKNVDLADSLPDIGNYIPD